MRTDLTYIADQVQTALTDLHLGRPDAAKRRLEVLQSGLLAEIAKDDAERTAWIVQERIENPVYAEGPWPGVL